LTRGSRGRYDPAVRAPLLVLLVASAAAAQDRQLVDEVVAVVDAHSITLSELQAETRIHLVEQTGPQIALAALDRPLLAASLRRLVDERVVLSEVERLKLFDLDRTEVESAQARFRARFPSAEAYEAFAARVEMRPDEIAAVLAREIRVARYLDNRLKLAAQPREANVDQAARKEPQADRSALRESLTRAKYDRLLAELLVELRRKANVRVLDPLDGTGQPPPDGIAEVR
jgi:SurA N-terminal domain